MVILPVKSTGKIFGNLFYYMIWGVKVFILQLASNMIKPHIGVNKNLNMKRAASHQKCYLLHNLNIVVV